MTPASRIPDAEGVKHISPGWPAAASGEGGLPWVPCPKASRTMRGCQALPVHVMGGLR